MTVSAAAPPPKARILVVEDDASIRLGLRMSLRKQGYEAHVAEDGQAALARLREQRWDIAIVDIMMPRLTGYELMKAMRNEHIDTPVIILSARSQEEDKVMGLDLGAEDYVTKPFSLPELMARVRAMLRRHQRPPQVFGEVVIDSHTRLVSKAGVAVELTATQLRVLLTLADAHGAVLTRKEIFDAVWGPEHHGTHRTIDNFIGQLRTKLERDASRPDHLLTVRGVGYRLVP
ncbi:MAG TPA: response regulator transcription factor [Sorangium sp.]|nr:response regulator transcription factor [Sorangium sp.]